MVIKQPAAAAGALLCTWALDQWARSQDSYFVINQGLTNWITTFGLLGALILRFFKGKSVFKPFTREYAALIAIYALALFSWFWSIIPDMTIANIIYCYRPLVVFGFLMPLAIFDLSDLRATFYTVLTIGFTLSILVLFTGKFDGRELTFDVGTTLIGGGVGAGNPLAIASMASYVALIAMLMNFRGKARIWLWLRYVVTAIAFALCVKSGSRGQCVSTLFVVLCFLPYSRRFKDLRSFSALAVSLTIFGAITLILLSALTKQEAVGRSYADRWSYEAFIGEYSASRIGTSLTLLSAWAQAGPLYWVIGLGSSAAFDPKICGFYPHVVFAEVLGELGLVGWVILWLFPIFACQNLRELWRYTKEDAEERGVIATLGGLTLFEIMMSFKQGSLLGSGICIAFVVMLGRITIALRQRAAEYEQLDAGMYEMTSADWDDGTEDYEEPVLGGVVMARS